MPNTYRSYTSPTAKVLEGQGKVPKTFRIVLPSHPQSSRSEKKEATCGREMAQRMMAPAHRAFLPFLFAESSVR